MRAFYFTLKPVATSRLLDNKKIFERNLDITYGRLVFRIAVIVKTINNLTSLVFNLLKLLKSVVLDKLISFLR
jgi:hypothetical protein